MKILVVDDEKLIRDILNDFLTRQGHTVKIAEDGAKALEVMKEFKADILISDIRMPGMNGIELSLEANKIYDTKIILISGYSTESELNKMNDVKYEFFSKPLRVKEIASKIDELKFLIEKEHIDINFEEFEYIDIDPELMKEFLTEGYDMLDSVEPRIIELAETAETEVDTDEINSIFRMFHSFKGTSSFLGLTNITDLTHEAETMLDKIRKDQMELRPEHMETFVKACDVIRLNMQAIEDEGLAEEAKKQTYEIVVELKKVNDKKETEDIDPDLTLPSDDEIRQSSSASESIEIILDDSERKEKVDDENYEDPKPLPSETEEEEEIEKEKSAKQFSDEFEFEITEDLRNKFVSESTELLDSIEESLLKVEEDPSNAVYLSTAFRNIHSFKGNAGFFGFKDLERVAHKMEAVLENMLDENLSADKEKIPVLLDMLDLIKGGVVRISEGEGGDINGIDDMMKLLELELGLAPQEPEEKKEAEIAEAIKKPVEEKKEVVTEKVEAPKTEKVVDKPKVEEKIEEVQKIEEPVKEEKPKEEPKEKDDKKKPSSILGKSKDTKLEIKKTDIRVDLEKLDSLLNLVGELVIASAMVTTNDDVFNKGFEKFEKAANTLSRIVKDLQEISMDIRMVPLAGVFSKMVRLIHDLARKSGKKVKLKTIGEQTEVDKTVIEMISDPLVHIIRNAVDHGIEDKEARDKTNKPETATVQLEARHEGGEVWILISDDGKGLSKDKILKKGIERGLIKGNGSTMSDEEIFALIFQPGFSTAAQVTEISGRGVGMDVVKRNLEKLKGTIDVKSKEGQGSTFILRIPLTLAIIDGMLVSVGSAKYVIPLLAIRESFKADTSMLTVSPEGAEIVRIRDDFYPVLRLHLLHEVKPYKEKIEDGILIIIENKTDKIALLVDEILGQESIVVKGLSDYIGNVKGVSGCTILGNGDICLIADVSTLIELASEKFDSLDVVSKE